MSKFALVSTVDTMGEKFPGHCVMVFDNKLDAVLHAIKILEQAGQVQHVEDENVYAMGEDHYEYPADALKAWQDSLTPTEFFHVMPVVEAVAHISG